MEINPISLNATLKGNNKINYFQNKKLNKDLLINFNYVIKYIYFKKNQFFNFLIF